MWRRWVVLVALSSATLMVGADDSKSDSEQGMSEETVDAPEAPPSTEWLIDTRDEWSKDINTLAVNIDRFFGGDEAQEDNESYVRLRAGGIWLTGGEIDSDSHIKLKLDLPGSKKRWKLLFESDPEEFSDLETQTRSTPTVARQFTDTEGAAGAIRFVVDEKSKWKKDFDVGVHGSTPLDPFARYQLRRSMQLDNNWSLYFKESISIFNSDGWGQKTLLNLEKPINDHYLWRNRIEAKFSDEDNVLETAFVMSTVHVLDDWSAIDYGIGFLTTNRPVSQTKTYFINTTYRKRLYKDWLFFDIRPELAFGRSYEEIDGQPGVYRKHGFKAQPSLIIGFDAYLWE